MQNTAMIASEMISSLADWLGRVIQLKNLRMISTTGWV